MKKLIYIITITLLSVWSCARFDDSKIWEEFDNYYERLEKLEAACDVMNSNISALQAIVTALQGNDYVTGVAEIVEDGEVVGYTITFSKSGVVKIYHGEDGADGEDGAPGADGRPGADGAAGPDGVDGENGHSPVVGVRKDADGVYYWTIDGEWMLDDEGQKVPATGKDGADASAGSDGKDGVTPLLKIEDGYWFVSYDGGSNWTKLYKAVGENGADGADGVPGQDGADGKDGADGDSFFQSVDTSSSENYIILTLSDGTQVKLPTWKAFEELQTMVNKLNTNLSALQTIVEALQNNDYVTGITPITKDGVEIGYTIDFSKSKSITVYHGKDGADGSDGAPGQNGEDGKDGKDGYTPVLGVKAADDDWSLDSNWNEDSEGQTRYYWTLDGEWLLDSDGNRIPATGANGAAGADGAAGLDGTTPKLKIVDGYWYVSLDGGQTWQPEPLGPATAISTDSIFSNIRYDSAYLYVELPGGELIKIARHIESVNEYCKIESIEIKSHTAEFAGHLSVSEYDVKYTQVTLYYSKIQNIDDFNIYNANKISTSTFDYELNFSIELEDLDSNSEYCYCFGVKVRDIEIYGEVFTFTTQKKEGKWLSVLYTGNENAHTEFMNFINDNPDEDSIVSFSFKGTSLWYGFTDAKIRSILEGKTIKKVACCNITSGVNIYFHTCNFEDPKVDVGEDSVLEYILNSSETEVMGTSMKEYDVNISIPANSILTFRGNWSIKMPAYDILSTTLPLKYSISSDGPHILGTNLPKFIGFDFYLE